MAIIVIYFSNNQACDYKNPMFYLYFLPNQFLYSISVMFLLMSYPNNFKMFSNYSKILQPLSSRVLLPAESQFSVHLARELKGSTSCRESV